MTFYFRAEQKPKSKAAKEGAEVFFSYHKSEKDNQSAIKDQAIDYFEAKGLKRSDYFQPKLFEIDENEFKNRPDDSEEISQIQGFDYDNFNSNKEMITADDIVSTVATIVLFGESRQLSEDELNQLMTFIKNPSGEDVRKFQQSVQVACSLMSSCYKQINVETEETDIEMCVAIVENYPMIESMIEDAIDVLSDYEIEIEESVVSDIKNRFEQIDIEENPTNSEVSPVIAALKGNPSFEQINDKRDFVITVLAHVGTLRSMTNFDDVEDQIIEHIECMSDVSELAVFSDFENTFLSYVEYHNNEEKPEHVGESAEKKIKNAATENSDDAEIERKWLWEALESRLNNRDAVKQGKTTTKFGEIKLCYNHIAPNITPETDTELLCANITKLQHCNVLFNDVTACQLVMMCKNETTPRERLAEKFAEAKEESCVDTIKNLFLAFPDNEMIEEDCEAFSENLKAILDEFENERYPEKFDRKKTIEEIKSTEFDTEFSLIRTLSNPGHLRQLVRDSMIFLEDGLEGQSNENPEIDSDDNEQLQILPEQDKHDSECGHDEPFADADNSDADINYLDLPNFDDEIEEIERKLSESDELSFDAQLVQLNGKIEALKPGDSLIIDDLSNALYHSCKGFSKSSLDIINQDPALLEWSKNCPVDSLKITSLDFGTAFHTAVLEPHKFEDEVVFEDFGRASKGGKDKIEKFKSNNPEKCLLTVDEMKQLELMRDSVFAHPRAKILYTHPSGVAERSIFWRDPESGIVFKIRTDWVCELNGLTFIVDLKSTANADDFEKSVGDFRYHVQDAFYSWVYFNATGNHPVFAFCATSKSVSCGKYKTRLVVLSEYDKEEGRAQFESNIRTLKGCIDTDNWGGFEEVERPAYQRRNDLTKGL